MLFGGAAPLIATSLVATTEDTASPAYLAMFAGTISLVAAFAIRGNRTTEL